jgi:hypothetical protein
LITEDRLEKIRARAAAASPPPWTWRRDPWLDVYLELEAPTGLVIEPALWDDGYKGFGLSPADAEFLEHARQDVDDLLAEIERLRAALQGLYDACCQADAIGELYGGINGDLLDAAANALKGGDA